MFYSLLRLVASQRRIIESLEEELEECRTSAVSRVQDGWMLEQKYARLLEERNRLRARLENYEEDLRRFRTEERRRNENDSRNRVLGFGFFGGEN